MITGGVETTPGEVLISGVRLSKTYWSESAPDHLFRAVDDVSLTIRRGESVAIVGESGSGKTTLSRLFLGLQSPAEGAILFHGVRLSDLDRQGRRRYRRSLSAVFQNPYSSLNPRMRLWQLIAEQLMITRQGDRKRWHLRAGELLDQVGLGADLVDSYPHQLSGGQRQRVAIARALVSEPDLVILDEATSALDVSVRAQIVNLLQDLQGRMGLTYMLITHDLAIVPQLCHRVMVMHRGSIVEEGDSSSILERPSHKATQALLDASYLVNAGIETDSD